MSKVRTAVLVLLVLLVSVGAAALTQAVSSGPVNPSPSVSADA